MLDGEATCGNKKNWKTLQLCQHLAELETACLVSFSDVSRRRQQQERN